MKSTDKATQETTEIVRPENPFRHVRKFIGRELSKYPIYKKLLDDAIDELNAIKSKTLRSTGYDSDGGHGSGVSDHTRDITIDVVMLELKINHLRWRIKRTEAGLEYFKDNKEILDLINIQFFVCNDWRLEEIWEKLGYSESNKNRYYRNLNKIYEVFSMFYGEGMP